MSGRVKWCLGGHPESQGRDEVAAQNLAGPEGCFSSGSESPCFLTFQTNLLDIFLWKYFLQVKFSQELYKEYNP